MASQNKSRDKLNKIYTDKTKKLTEETSDVSSQSGSYNGNSVMANQEHARTSTKSRRIEWDTCSVISETDTSNTLSNTSLSTSITRFRSDFEEMKCKMRIFGESLNLCRCIAVDFKSKLIIMEKRLEGLEKREKLWRSESNYSAIIQKNKKLSDKTMKEAKKLQMCGTEDEMREVAARICRNYLHGQWKTVDASQIEFRRISGGLSNFLYYVALRDDIKPTGQRSPRRESSPDTEAETCNSKILSKSLARSFSFNVLEEPKRVLLRIYGQVHGERAMDAIVTESVIFTLLSERKLGPKLHGVFSGGRIEQYIPARSLLTKELAEPALSMKIAEKMAAIHSMDVPLSKEPNWIWKTMSKWMKTVLEERLNASVTCKNEEEERIMKRLRAVDFEKELEWLKKYIATVNSPVVFCHNDLQEGNILLLEDNATTEEELSTSYIAYEPKSDLDGDITKPQLSQYEDANTSDSILSHSSDCGEPKLVLIDFEYCAYNYRGFDIANHFQEWAYNYRNPEYPFYYENLDDLPTLEQKEIFIKEYLKHYHAILNHGSTDEDTPTIDEVNQLLTEVDAFVLVSHLFWSMWSMVNASKSQIPFGYWEFAICRLDHYFKLKQEVVKDKYGFPQKRKICEVDI